MKKIISSIYLAIALIALPIVPVSVVMLAGCTTSQNTVVYKTLYGVEVSTTGAYDGYVLSIAKGLTTTNALPQVSQAFNIFQSTMSLAVLTARGDSNAIAPASVITASTDVINTIAATKGK